MAQRARSAGRGDRQSAPAAQTAPATERLKAAQLGEGMAEREGAAAACDWSDEEDASNINDAWKDAFDREVTRRPHRGVARDCLVP